MPFIILSCSHRYGEDWGGPQTRNEVQLQYNKCSTMTQRSKVHVQYKTQRSRVQAQDNTRLYRVQVQDNTQRSKIQVQDNTLRWKVQGLEIGARPGRAGDGAITSSSED